MDIYLRALEPEDYKTTIVWRKQQEDWDLLVGVKRFVSSETERKWVEGAIEKHESGAAFRFVICEQHSKTMLGMISAIEVDYHNRSFGISSLIGEASARGKGVIGKARREVMHYMFSELGMHKATTRILEDNVHSIRAVEKFGFKREGVLREAAFKSGRFKDLFVYGMLKSEFYGKHFEQ